MTFDPEQWNRWNSDPAAAYEEAERRIAHCAENRCDQLDLAVKLERIPPGISALTWLRELNLYGAPIGDFSALEPLGHLATLKLGSLHATFPGLDFVRDWQSLKVIELISTTTLDLAPLGKCTGLERLNVSCSQHKVELRNLNALSGCHNLRHVALLNMQSEEWGTIANWTALSFAQILGANLPSLDMFGRLDQLEYLSMSGSSVVDLSPLSGSAKLATLDVSETDVSSLDPVASMASLKELRFQRTAVRDLQPLAELAKLQAASWRSTSDGYRFQVRLRDVDAAGCPVSDVTPLASLDGLERLDLSRTKVTSLEPLHNHRNLRTLTISNTRIDELGPKGSLANLGYLIAEDCPIDSIAALAPGLSLQGVNLTRTKVADLNPLRRARSCRSQLLRGSRVKDLSPLLETGDYIEDHRYSRQELDFRDTPAASKSAELGRLAAIANEDPFKCFTETKLYLRACASSGLFGRLSAMMRR